MATWAIQVSGQDGRQLFAQVSRNGRHWKRKPLALATTYPTQVAATAVVTAQHYKKQSGATTKQTS